MEEITYMKKIALIGTFCNTEEKQDILYKNILKIKELGVDVMVLSLNFLPLPSHITEACDYFFYTKDNPLIGWPTRAYTHWNEFNHSDNLSTVFHQTILDYGYAALFQQKKLSQIALTFDYDIFYPMIYDIELDDNLINDIKKDKVNIVYKRKDQRNSNNIFPANLNFMILDRLTIEKVEKEITLDNYLKKGESIAEDEVVRWRDKFKLDTSEYFIKDQMYLGHWEDDKLFNSSPFSEFKMFISKHGSMTYLNASPTISIALEDEINYELPLTDNLRIVFYDIDNMGEIIIQINGVKYKESPKNMKFIEFPVSSQDITELIFKYNNKTVNLTREYSDISRNIIYNLAS